MWCLGKTIVNKLNHSQLQERVGCDSFHLSFIKSSPCYCKNPKLYAGLWLHSIFVCYYGHWVRLSNHRFINSCASRPKDMTVHILLQTNRSSCAVFQNVHDVCTYVSSAEHKLQQPWGVSLTHNLCKVCPNSSWAIIIHFFGQQTWVRPLTLQHKSSLGCCVPEMVPSSVEK